MIYTNGTIQKDNKVNYLYFREIVLFIFLGGGCYTDIIVQLLQI